MPPSLGPAVPIGFGGVLEWLKENGYLREPKILSDRESKGSKGSPSTPKAKREPSARSKAYSKAFRMLAPDYKKKNGSWKKDGFKRCVRAAHRKCK